MQDFRETPKNLFGTRFIPLVQKLTKTTGENRRKRGVATWIVRLERLSRWQALKSRSKWYIRKLRVSKGVASSRLGFKKWEDMYYKYVRMSGIYKRFCEKHIDDFSKVAEQDLTRNLPRNFNIVIREINQLILNKTLLHTIWFYYINNISHYCA